MDTIINLAGIGDSVLGYLVPFLFVLTLVVFFHELGHFLVARHEKMAKLVEEDDEGQDEQEGNQIAKNAVADAGKVDYRVHTGCYP